MSVFLVMFVGLLLTLLPESTLAFMLPLQQRQRQPFPSSWGVSGTYSQRTTDTQLHISSVRSWFSFAVGRKTGTDNAKSNKHAIFFKRQPSGGNNESFDFSTQDEDEDNSSVTTWANLLHDENSTTASVSLVASALDGNASNLTTSNKTRKRSGKRQATIQNGIFDPASTLWHFPEYTSAWANTLSMTLQNSTVWNTQHNRPTPLNLPPNETNKYNPISLTIPAYLRPNDTLTVADLQVILQGSSSSSPSAAAWAASIENYQSNSDKSSAGNMATAKEALLPASQSLAVPVSQPKETKQGVAFPQASVLDYKSLQRGTTACGTLCGILLSTSILPNLWLMGGLAGGIYGYDLCSRPDEPPPSNLPARTLISWGRRLSTTFLSVLDSCRTLWFLYKTGELSYQYYKRYEAMDKRFAIQNKVDAWNARFQEGKLKFDQWEQDNEIGRTVLAGLRTVWLVDEQSRRRAQRKSRYRVVQSLYDGKYWVTRYTKKTWKRLRTSNWSETMQEYWQGICTDVVQGSSWGTRIWAVLASLIAVNITGALFAISPTLLAIISIIVGIAWPSWVSEFLNRLKEVTLETRVRGRGGNIYNNVEGFPGQRLVNAARDGNTAKLLGRYDKDRYHYFRRKDGSKRYYRTGQSLFTGPRKATEKAQKAAIPRPAKSNTFSWPWTQPQKIRRPPGKEQWGIFSR